MKEHFPLDFEPYPHQAQVLGALENALKSDKKFILLRAPTGSGKSAIALSAALHFKSKGKKTHLLISRKFLQQQYLDEYSRVGLANIWGKANYPCTRAEVLNRPQRSCEECLAKSDARPSRYIKLFCSSGEYGNMCPYISARNAAGASSITMANYESFLAHAHYTKALEHRELMLVDEAHALDGRLANFSSVAVSARVLAGTRALKDLPSEDSGEVYATWIAGLINETLDSRISQYSTAAGISVREAQKEIDLLIAKDIPVPSGDRSAKERLMSSMQLKARLERVASLIASDPTNWVCYKVKGPSKAVESVEFKPVVLRGLSHKYMFDFANKVILISATLNTGPFLRNLGIAKRDVAAFIDVGSTFPINSRPLIANFCGSMTRAHKEITFPKIAERISEIVLQSHPNEKGCVHTHSFANTRELQRILPPEVRSRFIWHTKGSQNIDALIKKFYASEDKWLASPSCTEGLDGKGDLIRAQILIKAPYASIGDPRVSARKSHNDGHTWYAIEALNTLMQAYGRGTRSPTDYSVTYVLDSSFSNLVLKNTKHLPAWFVATWAKCSPDNWESINGRWRLKD